MGIGTQPAAWLSSRRKFSQLLFRNAAFEIGAGIDSRRGVALEVHHVTVAVSVSARGKMIERHFIQRGGRGISRNVAADALLHLVGPDDHGQRIPADQALDPALHLLAAGKRRLLPGRNGILIGRGGGEGQIDPGGAPGMQGKLLQQPAGPLRATGG